MEKRIYRSTRSKILGGVCGGLGEYFEIDPVLVRSFFVIATFGWGVSILAYIVLWIIIPSDAGRIIRDSQSFTDEIKDVRHEFIESCSQQNGKGRMWAGIIITITGVIFLIEQIFPILNHGALWPLLLVVVGVLIIIHKPREL